MAYKIEAAPSNRAHCRGPKPCNGTLIGFGELRLGVDVKFHERYSYIFRHWKCVTQTQMNNILNVYSGPEEIPGFKELCDEHKKAVLDTFENFEVPSYKIPADPKAKRKRNNRDRDVSNQEGVELESDYTDEEPIGVDSKPVSSMKETEKPRGKKGTRKTKVEGRSRKGDSNLDEHEESDLTDLEDSDEQPKNEPDLVDQNTHDNQHQQSEEDKPTDTSVKHQTRSVTRQQKRK